MKLFVGILTFLCAFADAADVSGRVEFLGPVPPPEELRMVADPGCLTAQGGKKAVKEDLVVAADKGLANTFVFVSNFKGTVPAAPKSPAKLDQKGCVYFPRVLGVQVGQPLHIYNSDAIFHNVHSMGKENSAFNKGMPKKGVFVEKIFTKAERMVRMKCDVHGWMVAWVGVMEHPFFATTDKAGRFTIKNLPDGEYTLETWHEKLGAQTAQIKVEKGKAAPLTLRYQ